MFLDYSDALDEESIGAFVYVQQEDIHQGTLFRDFDIQLLVVQKLECGYSRIDHVKYGDFSCQITRVGYKELRGLLVACEKNDLVKCLLAGELISDTEGRLANLSIEFRKFEQPLRDQKMLFEFSRFLRLYLEAKRFMSDGNILDAYHSVTDSLHHWARIELIERGIRPEFNVWEQVRGLNTAVHKLYEELTVSRETVQQRVELVLLGCEFSVLSKMSECSSILISVITSRNKPWSLEELAQHPELEVVSAELSLVLRKLVYRSKIKEVKIPSDLGINSKREILYTSV